MLDERLDRWSAATRGPAQVTRVLIADDHTLVRSGLRALLAAERGVQVLGEARDGREAVALTRELRPHVVVMDLTMPGLNGIEATRQIAGEQLGVKVLCLSMHTDEQFVSAAFQAGASGYLLKDSPPDEFVRAIRVVQAGQVFLSPAVAGTVVQGFTANAAATASPFTLLTDREREVLQLIAEGHETKQIAQTLGVSVKTVASHRERLQHKLNVHGVAGLTRYAIRRGLLGADRPTRR
jgi:DNA-binding NarL/FixJ family response regulator